MLAQHHLTPNLGFSRKTVGGTQEGAQININAKIFSYALVHLAKSMHKIFIVVLSLGAAWSYPLDGYAVKEEPEAYPKYHFEYGVKDDHTGDIKEQAEERDGEVVKGEYSLIEPDGTVRKVQYHDDGTSGFNAVVTRQGHAVQAPNKLVVPVSGYLH